MPEIRNHALAAWIDGNSDGTEVSLAGSLGPGLSLNELIKLSSDPQATTEALNFHDMFLAGATGKRDGLNLRDNIAKLYNGSEAKVTAEDVITANATTGANLLVLQTFISAGDHVVTMYPTYGALLEIPQHLGANVSYWRLDPNNNWKASLSDLDKLLTPTTKMLILNSPHNPTGSILTTSEQHDILTLAAKHNIIVHCDEIFRPLFHTDEKPTSIVEHDFYDRTIATGSLSKSWCFSGVRVGWCVTQNPELRKTMITLRGWILEATSMIDEAIATEILNERCRDNVHSRISSFALENRAALASFVKKHPDSVSCTLPPGGATAFVKFSNPKTGEAVDDLALCRKLKEHVGLLMSPGSLCFGTLQGGDFKGYVRMHLTCLPENFKRGIEKLARFIVTEEFEGLSVGGKSANRVNGSN